MKFRTSVFGGGVAALALLASCITINVYFPEEESFHTHSERLYLYEPLSGIASRISRRQRTSL